MVFHSPDGRRRIADFNPSVQNSELGERPPKNTTRMPEVNSDAEAWAKQLGANSKNGSDIHDCIQILPKSLVTKASETLALAFRSDPAVRYPIDTPDQIQRSEELRYQLHAQALEYITRAHHLSGGLVTAIGPELACVALWMPSTAAAAATTTPEKVARAKRHGGEPEWFDEKPARSKKEERPSQEKEGHIPLLTAMRSGLWRLNYQLSRQGRQRFFDEFLPLLERTKHRVLADHRRLLSQCSSTKAIEGGGAHRLDANANGNGNGDVDDEGRSTCWYLVYIGTKPDYRGRGYGRRMVEWGLKQASQTQDLVYLESTNDANVPFYASLGFKHVDTIFLGDNAVGKQKVRANESRCDRFHQTSLDGNKDGCGNGKHDVGVEGERKEYGEIRTVWEQEYANVHQVLNGFVREDDDDQPPPYDEPEDVVKKAQQSQPKHGKAADHCPISTVSNKSGKIKLDIMICEPNPNPGSKAEEEAGRKSSQLANKGGENLQTGSGS